LLERKKDNMKELTITAVGITHVWPRRNQEAKPISDEHPSDVWDEIRHLTEDEDVRGNVHILTHEGALHGVTRDEIGESLRGGNFVYSRVQFTEPKEFEREVYCSKTNSAEMEDGYIFAHLDSWRYAQTVIEMYNRWEISALVLWLPEKRGGETGHLKYLPLLHEKCPDLPIYIFHWNNLGEQWGVEREGRYGSWQNSFHTKAEALTVPENVDVVVRGLCNVGSVSMWGALPKHGKSYLFLSLMKALLSGKPWLDYFEVSKSKRVVYLVPEVGLRGVMKRLRKLNMVDYLYDPSTSPDGVLFLQTLSSRDKLKLDDAPLLEAVKGADVFVDPLIRYIEGEENNASDQRMLSNKLLALISAEARSVWCAHHSPKAFKDVTDITTQNVLRGTGEFAAFPDIIFGVLKTNDETSRLYIKCTDARDDDEYLGDFEVEMRPWIDQTGDLKLVVPPGTGTPLKEQKRTTKTGPKTDLDRQAKIAYAKSVEGSMQDKAVAVNEKFGTQHSRSTIHDWLTPFDADSR
jgi:AAA domain